MAGTVQELRRTAETKKNEADAIMKRDQTDEAGNPVELSDADLERAEALYGECDEILSRAQKAERCENLLERSKSIGAGGRVTNPLPHQDGRNMRGKEYSLLRALDFIADQREPNGVEGEVHKELLKRSGKTPQGVLLPNDLKFMRRDDPGVAAPSVTTSTGSGAMGVTTANTVIELLKQGNVLGQLGMQVVSDMVGAFSLPKLTAGSTAQWVAEGDSPAKSGLSIGAVGFAPKQLSAVLVVSRKSMKQSSVSLENLTRADLATEFSGKIEQTVLVGSGEGAEPEGLLYNSLTGKVEFKSGSGGGAPTWAKMLEFELRRLAKITYPILAFGRMV